MRGEKRIPRIYTPSLPSTFIHMKWFWNNIIADSRGNNKSKKAKKKKKTERKKKKLLPRQKKETKKTINQ